MDTKRPDKWECVGTIYPMSNVPPEFCRKQTFMDYDLCFAHWQELQMGPHDGKRWLLHHETDDRLDR